MKTEQPLPVVPRITRIPVQAGGQEQGRWVVIDFLELRTGGSGKWEASACSVQDRVMESPANTLLCCEGACFRGHVTCRMKVPGSELPLVSRYAGLALLPEFE